MKNPEIQQKINDYKCCVLVPTYNNHKTLKRVLNGILNYTKHIIVINDGSTDTTKKILSSFQNIEVIHLPKNKGKGNALNVGLLKAEELGFEYAISIDSDGQHYPDDIPLFIEALSNSENKNLLLIGARNLNADGMPKKNSFANKFSNFWFWAETGVKLQDTQSGFRLYPIKNINKLNLFTTKYEFEIEVMVKASWQGVEVKNIPIRVLYDEEERVSHFRPFKDFLRISLLNTWLVFIALIYIKPRDLLRSIKKKGIKQFFYEDVLKSGDSHLKKALSISLGIFVGLSPFWGLQSFLAIFLAQIFKLNKAISFGFSNISIPPFIPFIIYGSLKIGGYLLNKDFSLNFDEITTNFSIKTHLLQYVVGSLTLGCIGAVLFGFTGYFFLKILNKKEK